MKRRVVVQVNIGSFSCRIRIFRRISLFLFSDYEGKTYTRNEQIAVFSSDFKRRQFTPCLPAQP